MSAQRTLFRAMGKYHCFSSGEGNPEDDKVFLGVGDSQPLELPPNVLDCLGRAWEAKHFPHQQAGDEDDQVFATHMKKVLED